MVKRKIPLEQKAALRQLTAICCTLPADSHRSLDMRHLAAFKLQMIYGENLVVEGALFHGEADKDSKMVGPKPHQVWFNLSEVPKKFERDPLRTHMSDRREWPLSFLIELPAHKTQEQPNGDVYRPSQLFEGALEVHARSATRGLNQ